MNNRGHPKHFIELLWWRELEHRISVEMVKVSFIVHCKYSCIPRAISTLFLQSQPTQMQSLASACPAAFSLSSWLRCGISNCQWTPNSLGSLLLFSLWMAGHLQRCFPWALRGGVPMGKSLGPSGSHFTNRLSRHFVRGLHIAFRDEFYCPLPEGHTFPMQKYPLLYQRLCDSGILETNRTINPQEVVD